MAQWHALLQPTGGWVVIAEVSGMLKHEPLAASTQQLLCRFQAASLADGSYDFDCGAKLASCMAAAGFQVLHSIVLPDQELSFQVSCEHLIITAYTDSILCSACRVRDVEPHADRLHAPAF